MLNHVAIMGRLTADPELRKTTSGTSVTNFTLACDRDYKSDSGERQADFVDVVTWRNTAEFVSKYFSKGSAIIVVGRLQTRNWTDKDGNNRRAVEIVADSVYFGGGKKDVESPKPYEAHPYTAQDVDFDEVTDDESELPF